MGFFDSLKQTISDDLHLGLNNNDIDTDLIDLYPDDNLWSINGQDWYKVFGYQFKIVVTDGSKDQTPVNTLYYTLPIPPQAYQVKPIIPNKVTATMGGVTEENSAVTFWVISMAGTTGTGVSRAKGDETTRKKVAGQFRDTISTTGLLSGTFSNVSRAINKVGGLIDGIGNIASDISNLGTSPGGSSISELTGDVTGAINNALLPPLTYSSSAVNGETNGFTEAEELSKFFYIYQRLKADNPNKYFLYFINYKTNQQWRVAIRDFSLQKNAANPMLYKYNIALQGWDISPSSSDPSDREEQDRFGPKGDLATVNTMAFNTKAVTSVLQTAKKKIFGG